MKTLNQLNRTLACVLLGLSIALTGCDSDDDKKTEPTPDTVNTADTSAKDDGQADDTNQQQRDAEAERKAEEAEAERRAEEEARQAEEEAGPVDLTGQWSFKTFVMTLRHSGTSVQGRIVDTNPSSTLLDVSIAGQSDGENISVKEVVTHTEESGREDYTVTKTGVVEDKNHFQLHTDEGPFPGWQRWTRII